MNYKLISACIATFIVVIAISCGEKTPSGPDTVTPPDTHTVGIPKNIKIDSLILLDTAYTMQVYDTLTKTYFDTTFDTLLGSFVARWDTVLNAARFFIFVHYKNGDFIRAQVADTNRRAFIGGLIPDNAYYIRIAAVRYVADTLDNNTIEYDTVVGKKSDSASASLFFPLSPERIFVNASGNSAHIAWTPSISPFILGYTAFLVDIRKPDTQHVEVDSATLSVNFPAAADRGYKAHVITRTKIGHSPVCSSFVYDINNLQDTGFKLPYVYLSTYSRPDESGASSTVLGAGYMIGVKGGIFAMGDIWGDTTTSDNGKPVHEAVVSSFYLGSREISNALFLSYLNDLDTSTLKVGVEKIITGNDTLLQYIYVDSLAGDTLLKQQGPIYYDTVTKKYAVTGDSVHYPVAGVYWKGAARFCNWLSSKDTLDTCYNTSVWDCDTAADGYRLPTEAEFEYAHAAAFLGSKQRFPWGYKDDVTKYSAKKLSKSGIFGQYFGFYDMSGNVLEWCNDFSDYGGLSYYNACLMQGVVYNPAGPGNGDSRVLRGGSYMLKGLEASSSFRHSGQSVNVLMCGFRVARKSK